MKQSIETAQK